MNDDIVNAINKARQDSLKAKQRVEWHRTPERTTSLWLRLWWKFRYSVFVSEFLLGEDR